jgi:hypothetical protein
MSLVFINEWNRRRKRTRGLTIRFGPADIECLTCGEVYTYDGRDFRLKVI